MSDVDKTAVLYTGTRAPKPLPENLVIRHVPMLEVEPVPVSEERLSDLFDESAGMVVYSQNAIRCIRRSGAQKHIAPFDRHIWWSVGEKTAEAIHREFGVRAHVPSVQNFEGLKSEMSSADLPDRVISLSLYGKTRDLSPILTPRHIDFVDLPIYRTVPANHEGLDSQLSDAAWVIFTSPRGVRTFFEQAADGIRQRLASLSTAAIGPKTAAALEELNAAVDFVPEQPDLDEIFRAIAQRQPK